MGKKGTNQKAEKTAKGKSEGPVDEQAPAAEGVAEASTEESGEEKAEPTLAELTSLKREELERELADELDNLGDDISELKNAQAAYKEAKKTVTEQRVVIHKINLSLREVIRGEWRPAKPDPQREIPWPDNQDPQGGTPPADPEPEAEVLWKSKPMAELGLPKTIMKKLEEEGFPTLGTIAAEFENGREFEGLGLSDPQIQKIREAWIRERPKPAPVVESDPEPLNGDADLEPEKVSTGGDSEGVDDSEEGSDDAEE